ncbi:MAG: hypothetical protein AVDCRST_MAG13-3054, partial [uncultured Solirubrobacteraceae bacterium]
ARLRRARRPGAPAAPRPARHPALRLGVRLGLDGRHRPRRVPLLGRRDRGPRPGTLAGPRAHHRPAPGGRRGGHPAGRRLRHDHRRRRAARGRHVHHRRAAARPRRVHALLRPAARGRRLPAPAVAAALPLGGRGAGGVPPAGARRPRRARARLARDRAAGLHPRGLRLAAARRGRDRAPHHACPTNTGSGV